MESLLLILVGLFSIICAIGNWEFFMGARRAAFFVRIFGRTGARIFYVLLGLFISTIGLFTL